MNDSLDKYGEYLTERFRKLGIEVTRFIFVMLLILIYTWYESIFPRQVFMKQFVTIFDKGAYFDTLISTKRKNKTQNVKYYNSEIDKYTRSIEIGDKKYTLSDAQSKTDTYNKLIRKATSTKEKSEALKEYIKRRDSLKGSAKSKVDSLIKADYDNNDVIIAIAEIKRDSIQQQSALLINKSPISFNIPVINKLSLGFIPGLLFWVFLNLVLLLYLFFMRQKLVKYLKEIYVHISKNKQVTIADWQKLDLQVPILLGPIYIKKDKARNVFRAMLNWDFGFLNNLSGMILLALIIVTQLHVVWLSWNVLTITDLANKLLKITDFATDLLKFATIALLAVSLFVVLVLLNPIVLSENLENQHSFSFGRREAIKLGISSCLFFFFIPKIGKSLPVIKAYDLHYKRHKKQKKPYKVNLEDGFYAHKKKGRLIVHKFEKGVSLTMKTIPEEQMALLIPKLKKINVIDIVNDNSCYSVPHRSHLLEKEAMIHIKNNDYFMATKILLFALSKRSSPYEKNCKQRYSTLQT